MLPDGARSGQVCNRAALAERPELVSRAILPMVGHSRVRRPVSPTRTSRFRPVQLGLLLAWLLATGLHLDVLQFCAWTRMAFRFARTESVGEAIVTTLRPESMCHLCHTVQRERARRREQPVLAQAGDRPVLVFLALPEVVVVAPRGDWSRVWAERSGGIGRARPPLPPPRGGMRA